MKKPRSVGEYDPGEDIIFMVGKAAILLLLVGLLVYLLGWQLFLFLLLLLFLFCILVVSAFLWKVNLYHNSKEREEIELLRSGQHDYMGQDPQDLIEKADLRQASGLVTGILAMVGFTCVVVHQPIVLWGVLATVPGVAWYFRKELLEVASALRIAWHELRHGG